ncbi:MAG TPA: hypothetical protein VFJ30_02475 [Phycisphaerae bacterium]|nr:hypothetical protein [Phycisphaerae bacterium]
MKLTGAERTTLRDLARRVAEIAADPVMETRRRLWVEHNSLRPARPMMLVFPEGSWCELIGEADLLCRDAAARRMEFQLRSRIYTYEHFREDTVIEAVWDVGPAVELTGWGLQEHTVPSSEARGAHAFEPVLKGPADLAKLRHPDVVYDEAATAERVQRAGDLLGDILKVRRRGIAHVSFHLASQYLRLRGPSAMLMDMVDEPGMVHDAMAFFAEGHRRILAQYRQLNLLDVNNDGTYHSSGGNGYTDQLPAAGFDAGRVRPCDMWASAESQEFAGVSPAMHQEFTLRYEAPLLEPFGLTGYGCCEDLTAKLDLVCAVPNMRRISISPWANVDACAARLKGDYIFSWKPNPAMLVGRFDEDAVAAYVRHTLDAAKANGCVLEMVLKDTHTCQHHPERFDRWTEITRRQIEEVCPEPV